MVCACAFALYQNSKYTTMSKVCVWCGHSERCTVGIARVGGWMAVCFQMNNHLFWVWCNAVTWTVIDCRYASDTRHIHWQSNIKNPSAMSNLYGHPSRLICGLMFMSMFRSRLKSIHRHLLIFQFILSSLFSTIFYSISPI